MAKTAMANKNHFDRLVMVFMIRNYQDECSYPIVPAVFTPQVSSAYGWNHTNRQEYILYQFRLNSQ
jgi:hypothetical protein